MLSLGIDIGSSSVKVSIYDHDRGMALTTGQYPEQEMKMIVRRPGWAEQDPEEWWEAFKAAFRQAIRKANVPPGRILSIGISYQMHGLVCLDSSGHPLRPSIIWCDSRAVEIGRGALEALGEDYALTHLLNSPGNFTASKLAWVKQHEPRLFEQIDKICLPGDFIALRLTGELTTTLSGLTEGILYDFKNKTISKPLLEHFGFPEDILPPVKNAFDDHGQVSAAVAKELGLSPSGSVTYKAGDQPNNAFSLNALHPGEVAATAGTSGVVYGISDRLFIDPSQRVNSFAHVNYQPEQPRIGILLCINGVGIANAWARRWTQGESYRSMNEQADRTPPGSEGLTFLPFGNGTERMLGNRETGAQLAGLNFNVHSPAHLYRAVQEGIAFAFRYGMEAFPENDVDLKVIRAGYANLFLSPLFSRILATLSGIPIELFNTDGSLGAARGALVGAGRAGPADVFKNLERIRVFEPEENTKAAYQAAYRQWKELLRRQLEQSS